MKKFIFTLGSCLLLTASYGQLNMSLIAQVDYDQTTNDIWGYVAEDSTEYALVGTRNGLSIVSLADPENPFEAIYIPGPSSLWRDIKTWSDHVYVTNETSNGLLVVDMAGAPDNITWTEWTPTIPGLGTLSSIHNFIH